MKIDEIKVNSYGKLNNKEIKLYDGINIIYGENEKGKSTLLNFVVNMFYGTSKNKKGRDISDFDKYKPWNSEEFSGKMNYTLDNGDSYEVFREFGKKNPKIYDKNMEEVTKQYSIDKNTGSQFFLEQTNVNEQVFVSTVVSFQNEIKIDNQTQNVLLQKIANTSSTGDDNISYKKAIEKLNKKQLDEIGTNRSQEKPINIVMREIEKLNDINKSLAMYESYKYEIEEKKYAIEKDIQKLNEKYELLNKLDSINQKQHIEEEKLRFSEVKIDELEDKIQNLTLQKKIVEQNKESLDQNSIKKSNIILYVLGFILLLGLTAILGIFVNIVFSVMSFILSLIILLIGLHSHNEIKKINSKEIQNYNHKAENNKILEKNIYEINAQIEILEKSQKDQINEAEQIKNELLKEIKITKEQLKKQFAEKIDFLEMEKILNLEDLSFEKEKIQRNLNDKNLELHKLNLDQENILPKLEEFAENEEKLSYNKEVLEDLKKKDNAINLAKEILENAYQKMKGNVTPRFAEKLSKNISYITNNKYNKIVINEEDGLLVQLQNGEYKNANRLSIGTIEQLYLSFRLSMIDDISEENMPIILDEIFAFYDDNRLTEAIKNMYEQYTNKHQIILFTCTKREEEALKKLGIKYNIVYL